jgi:hypothetical protein
MAMKMKKQPSLADLFALAQSGATGGREQAANEVPPVDFAISRAPSAVENDQYLGALGAVEPQPQYQQPLISPMDPMAIRQAYLDSKNGLPKSAYSKITGKEDENGKASSGSTFNTTYSPEEWQRLQDQAMGITRNPLIGAIVDPENPYQQQLQGTKDAENLLRVRAENTNPQVDLSPLVGLVDTWTGSHLAQNYKRPAPYSDTFDAVLSAKKGLSDQKAKMAKELVDSIRAMKSGSVTDQFMQAWARSQGLQLGDQKENTGRPDRSGALNTQAYITAFMKNPQLKPIADAAEASAKVVEAVKTGNWLGDKQAFLESLKAARLAPVSDSDKAELRGNPSLLSAVERGYNKLSSGDTYTPSDRNDVQAYAEYLHWRNQKAFNGIAKSFSNANASRFGVGKPEDGMQILGYMDPAIPGQLTGAAYKKETGKTLKAPAPGAAPKPKDGMIPVLSPDGKPGMIPASQKEAALQKGYKMR